MNELFNHWANPVCFFSESSNIIEFTIISYLPLQLLFAQFFIGLSSNKQWLLQIINYSGNHN